MYQSAVEYVVASLRQEILSGEFLPGTPILEAEYARRHGVSVTPVREALRHFEADGLVVRRRHRDIRIRTFTLGEAKAVYDLRAVLEPMAAGLCAEYAGPEAIERLKEILETQEQAESDGVALTELERLNNDFHMGLAEYSGNRMLKDAIERIWPMVGLLRATSWLHFKKRPREVVTEHEGVLRAVIAKDRREAIALSHRHAILSWKRVEAALTRAFAEAPETQAGDAVIADVMRDVIVGEPEEVP